jgi:hypothetical protein
MIDLLLGERDAYRLAPRVVARSAAFAFAAAALALGGCSVSIPLPGFIDDQPTGSIKPKAAPAALSAAYDSGDWRLAEPVLSATLRAKDGDQPGAWSNPETGTHGEFLAVAGSFERDGHPCRAFVARVVGKDGAPVKTLQGVGCPREGEEAAIYDVSPWTGL